MTSLAGFLAPGGTAIVCEVAEENLDMTTWMSPPWPFSREEIESVAQDGVKLLSLETIRDGARYWAEFTRSARNRDSTRVPKCRPSTGTRSSTPCAIARYGNPFGSHSGANP